jgi:hypothetical protein
MRFGRLMRMCLMALAGFRFLMARPGFRFRHPDTTPDSRIFVRIMPPVLPTVLQHFGKRMQGTGSICTYTYRLNLVSVASQRSTYQGTIALFSPSPSFPARSACGPPKGYCAVASRLVLVLWQGVPHVLRNGFLVVCYLAMSYHESKMGEHAKEDPYEARMRVEANVRHYLPLRSSVQVLLS